MGKKVEAGEGGGERGWGVEGRSRRSRKGGEGKERGRGQVCARVGGGGRTGGGKENVPEQFLSFA